MNSETRDRTYSLPNETISRIDALARSLRVHQSDLVSHLLAFGLDAVESGGLVLSVRPERFRIDRERAGVSDNGRNGAERQRLQDGTKWPETA